MATADARGATLSDDDRRQLEAWVEAFDRDWDDGLLARRSGEIPPGSSLRLPALTEMVKLDLERQWQRGNRIALEAYLKQYPELGTPADVSADLIRVEYEVRSRFGAPADLDDYARRFPRQAEALRRLIEAPPPAPEAVAAPGAASSRRIPKQFGRYEILKPLGRGGMGAVFLAQDTKLGRKVALKVPSFGPDEGPEALARFDREARAAATLDHPNICPVYDVGVIDGFHYLTMAYIEGRSLAEAVAEEGPQSPRKAAAIVGKLALALQEAHARGIVHRDLKPSNVMLKEAGKRREPVLVDFGLARDVGAEDVRLTQSGTALGTVAYMAPEQVRGDATIGPGADIYGLGVILYELLTGQPPFEGPYFVVAAQVLTQEPPPPSSLRSGLDPRIEAICRKATSKSIADRFATMADLAAAIAEYLRAAPAAAPAPVPTPPSAAPASAPPIPSPATQPAAPPPPRVAAEPRPPREHADSTSGDMQVAQFLNRLAGVRDSAEARPGLVAHEPSSEPPPEADDLELEDETEASSEGARWRPRILLLVAAAAASILLAATILYVTTNKGRIKIAIDDPRAVVKVDGDVVRVENLGEPISLRPGEHDLEVTWGNGSFTTRKFAVRRGDNDALEVSYEPHEDDAARRVDGRGEEAFPKEVTSPATGMVLVRIEPGEFDMGSGDEDKARDEEKPRHHVRITRPFYISKYEVTRGQFRKFVEDTGHDAGDGWLDPGFMQTDDHPIVKVSWIDAVAFCKWLSEKEGVTYRLPTEAEWEYACRAGSTTRYSFGDDVGRLGDFACFSENSGGGTHPVGEKRPNAFGLYDMHGNVCEWCSDRYDADYYKRSPPADPQGPFEETAPNRVCRGGGWDDDSRDCRSTNRNWYEPAVRGSHLGFRVVRADAPAPVESRKAVSPAVEPSRSSASDPKVPFINSVGMTMKLIPAGEFVMGADPPPPGSDDAKDPGRNPSPKHRVRISRPFYLGIHEVTQEQYEKVVGANPSEFQARRNLPVDSVSWFDAVEFCNKLSAREHARAYYRVVGEQVTILGGDGYRLPTEAEWEYACRAGTTTTFYHGEDPAKLGDYAWGAWNSGGNYASGHTNPVGRKLPNAFGLFDMCGNVREWCWDWRGPYPEDRGEAVVDPVGPNNGTERVTRGGSFGWYTLEICTPWNRQWQGNPRERKKITGFRIARTVP